MATATKKSPAYDKGYREGKADKAKKPAPAMESPEGEEEESPEEEEMDAAKGRKRDGGYMKTPMDGSYGKKSMDATCTCGAKSRKGKKCSCGAGKKDGMCGSARKMDSLTAPEYLDACELGINRRSNSYIRARLDAAARLDLKCGAGAISEGEKCHKGNASKVTTNNSPIALNELRRPWFAGDKFAHKSVTGGSGKGYIRTMAKRSANQLALTSGLLGALGGGMAGFEQGGAVGALKGAAASGVASGALGYGVGYGLGATEGAIHKVSGVRSYRNEYARRKKYGDSIWAAGF